jgi:hypothetical protein
MSDAHDGKVTTCHHPNDDDLDEPTEVNFADHGSYVRSPHGKDRHGTDLRDRFDQSALRFDCPTCGVTTWVCPVCSDHLDPSVEDAHHAPGWFYGDSTGDALACHNCNSQEAARQERTITGP